jgi:hypothetical protein
MVKIKSSKCYIIVALYGLTIIGIHNYTLNSSLMVLSHRQVYYLLRMHCENASLKGVVIL